MQYNKRLPPLIVGIKMAYEKLKSYERPKSLISFQYDVYIDKYLKYLAMDSGLNQGLLCLFRKQAENLDTLANAHLFDTYDRKYIRALKYLYYAIINNLSDNDQHAKYMLSTAVMLLDDIDYMIYI